jgi:hypothetical protein
MGSIAPTVSPLVAPSGRARGVPAAGRENTREQRLRVPQSARRQTIVSGPTIDAETKESGWVKVDPVNLLKTDLMIGVVAVIRFGLAVGRLACNSI